MSLKIIKPKTRPVQIEPWFHRYLTNNEIKVVSAILTYADMRDRSKNFFHQIEQLLFIVVMI